MPRDLAGRSALGIIVAVAVCCGAAALLVSAGVLGAGAGLFGSPELTVAAVLVAVAGVWRLTTSVARQLRRDRGDEVHDV